MRNFDFGKKVNEEVANVVKETINPSFIKDMIRGFVNIPTEVIMRPKTVGKNLQISVTMAHQNSKIKRTYKSFVDSDLIQAIIDALGNDIRAIQAYKIEEHEVEEFEQDMTVELFSQLLKSEHRCYFGENLVTSKGESYLCAKFNIGYKKEIHFCLKRTEELEKLIFEACRPEDSAIEYFN